MKRETPLRLLVAAQLGCAGAAAAFHLAVRPELRARYAEADLALSWTARLASSPAPAIAVALLTAVALLSAASRLPRGRRLRHLATTTALSGALFVAAVLGAMAPLLG